MLDKKYYLGIDGGGTKTAFAIIDENNELIYFNEQGASSLDTVSLSTVKEVFIEGTKGFNYKVDSVFVVLGGIANDNQIKDVINIVKELPICKETTKVDAGNDVVNALYGSLGGLDGLMIIAGTGSVCFGKNKDKVARAGGYCYQEGDAGSSYDLGYKALQHLARVIDYRYEETEFSLDLKKVTNCYDYASLASYFINANRTQIASLSRVVTRHQLDKYAQKIIINAVDEILLMIKSVYNQLDFKDEEVYFSIIGSLGNADTLYKNYLLENLKNISLNIKYIEKKYEAYIGSALKAKELK